jgi:hypothetical protein
MTATYTPTLPKLGGFDYRPSLTPEQMALTVLRSLRDKSISGEFFQDALSVLASLAKDHQTANPEYDMSEAQEAIDIAACKWMELRLPEEPAAVLHGERVDAALMGGSL